MTKSEKIKMQIIDYDAVYGYVNYGTFDIKKNGGYCTKMRCKKCGAAWLSENEVSGFDTCPKCNATGRNVISIK